MPVWFFLVLQVSSIACAIVGGVFLAFSDFIMRSLNRAESGAGIEAMQVINREVLKSVFIVLLLGLSALSPVMIGYALFNLGGLIRILVMLGGAIYLVGVFAVTVVFNVPMNNRLAGSKSTSQEGLSYWASTYFPDWTAWNHVRASASVAAAICYLAACVAMVQASLI
ncbi:DUF1772 domain-containing protein [Hoeflea sp. TYP-13]|uniref:DUF1772 domain-containing protein n=1 Tax=Hoeflea sp. TYP-13 TaxID=3230023 RepID=UPI0034C66EC0